MAEYCTATSDLIGFTFEYGTPPLKTSDTPVGEGTDFVNDGGTACAVLHQGNSGYVINASASPYIAKHWEEWSGSGQYNYIEGAAGAYEYDGRTVYWSGGSSNKFFSEYANVPINEIDGSIEIDTKKVAWTMIYGDIDCPEPPEPCEDVEMLPHSPCKKHDIYIPPCGCPPVRIEITVLPDKLNYQRGEDIDLTGIVVRAFKANGNLWGGFPHGIIPIEELDYEPKIAPQGNSTITVSWNYNGETFTDTYEIGG